MPKAENLVFTAAEWNRHAALSCAEMRHAEEIALAEGVESLTLMKRAGEAVAALIIERFRAGRVLVLCGPGKNGGDGFIVAEMLNRAGWEVSIGSMKTADELTGDVHKAATNWWGKITPLADVAFDKADLIVDALFGIGLTRALDGQAAAVIEKMRQSQVPVVAVDLPSGINGDNGAIMGCASQAALTVTFFRKKIGQLLMPGAGLCGEITVADIGMCDHILDTMKPRLAANDRGLWIDLFPFPKIDGHKYDRGHALIAGGAVLTGASRLGARAAQRIGAGLVSLAAPAKALPIYAQALESVMVCEVDTVAAWNDLLIEKRRNALLLGPGLGIGAYQKELVLAALASGKACVLDADALTNFAFDPDALFFKLNTDSVLTPHEGEFARLFGSRVDPTLDKIARTRKAAQIAGCSVLLKGADTVIADPDGRVVVNTNAPPWLAIGGAGDVLAGMILGLIAQGMHAFAAAAAATWLHGLGATRFGPGLIAEDLVDGLPAVLRGLSDSRKSV